MCTAVDSTLRDELARAADDLTAASREQASRAVTHAQLLAALHDVASILTIEQVSRLHPGTRAALDAATIGEPSTPA